MYGYEIEDRMVDNIPIKFAKWNHPGQTDVDFNRNFFLFMKNYIQEGDCVIDVGPHVGFQTLMYGLRAGKSGKVFAFEPNPWVLEPFKETCSLNSDKTNIIPIKLAAMEVDGTYTFHYSDGGYCNGGLDMVQSIGHVHKIEVEGVNVSKFMKKEYPEDYFNIKFIKTDTEGHDLQVLKSLLPIINTNRPIIQSEIFLTETIDDVKNKLDFFDDLDYITYFMPEQKQIALGDFDLFSFIDKECTPDMAEWLKKISNGEDILSIPREKMNI